MRRLNPTMLAAIALAVIVLLLVAVFALRSRGGADDRLTDNQLAESREDPEERCASRSTYDLIKRELFRRAAELRGSNRADFDRIAAYSAVRMEAPVLRDENAELDSVTCSGTLSLDLPPGVAVVGGRRTLTADILYTVQPAADGSGAVLTLQDADSIIAPLATLARVDAAPGDPLAPPATTNAVIPEPAEPGAPPAAEPPPGAGAEPPAPVAPPRPTANPSFDCDDARTRGEIAVCSDPGLARLDRQMAAQFSSAMAAATPGQRALLQRTRGAFLSFRDRCATNACMAAAYRDRMREIADIMAGRWRP